MDYAVAESSLAIGNMEGGATSTRLPAEVIKYYPKGKLIDGYYKVKSGRSTFYIKASYVE